MGNLVMTLGQNFPISDYYKGNILDAVTLNRSGQWWTAILLIEDPRSKKPFISLYRWQRTDAGWKIRSRFKIARKQDGSNVIKVIEEFLEKLL
jgi:hypothetical protein